MSIFPSLPLYTERLQLRPLSDADLAGLFSFRSNPETMRYWSSPPTTNISEVEKTITEAQKSFETGEYLALSILRKSDDRFVGFCTLFDFHRSNQRAEVGYGLDRPFWGQGYMNEALIRLVQYAFDELSLNRLEADIDPRNIASAKTLKRLGFVKEGHLRERWIVAGEVSDSDIYGLIRKDWLKHFQIGDTE